MENYVKIIKENLEKYSRSMRSYNWMWFRMGALKRACRDSGFYSESELKTIDKKLFWAGYWGWTCGRHFFNQAKEMIESKFPTTSNDEAVLPSNDSVKNN